MKKQIRAIAAVAAATILLTGCAAHQQNNASEQTPTTQTKSSTASSVSTETTPAGENWSLLDHLPEWSDGTVTPTVIADPSSGIPFGENPLNDIKKPVEMNSGDYKILSGSSMWERHQAAGEEPSGDYVTAFYPLEVYAKNGDVYVIAAEFDADKKDMYYINNAPIKGNILPIPTEHLEDFKLATVGQNICPYYLSVNSRTPAGETIGAVISGILAVLFAVSGIALLASTKRKEG